MPHPTLEYTVVFAPTGKDLIHRVTQRIAEGWEPLGGASVSHSNGEMVLCQAMTREVRSATHF